jgi:hypothetical protein
LNIIGILNTWFVKWYSSVLLNGGLCLHPKISYVQNIGFGEEASNTKSGSDILHIDKLANEVNIYDIPIEESIIVRDAMINFYDSTRRNNFMKFLFKNYTKCLIIRLMFLIYNKYNSY